MPVVGAAQPYFERGVVQPHHASPRGWDEKVDIGALLVHVLDAVCRLIILHPGTGALGASPGATSAGEGRMRAGLTQDAAVEALLHAVAMALLCAIGRPCCGGRGRQRVPATAVESWDLHTVPGLPPGA
jgi:hypothetical protein